MIILVLAFAYACWCLWTTVDAVRTGVVTVRSKVSVRSREPIDFWASVANYWVMAILGIAIGFLIR